jgi:hypothetical protein
MKESSAVREVRQIWKRRKRVWEDGISTEEKTMDPALMEYMPETDVNVRLAVGWDVCEAGWRKDVCAMARAKWI